MEDRVEEIYQHVTQRDGNVFQNMEDRIRKSTLLLIGILEGVITENKCWRNLKR